MKTKEEMIEHIIEKNTHIMLAAIEDGYGNHEVKNVFRNVAFGRDVMDKLQELGYQCSYDEDLYIGYGYPLGITVTLRDKKGNIL